jgi:paraquat-inducible protein B
MELPTIPSDIEQLKANIANVLAKIDKLPLDRLTDDIIKTIGDAVHLVNDADSLVNNVNGRVQPLSARLIDTSVEAGSLFKEAKARLEMRPGEPLVTLNQTLNDARRLVNNVDASWPQISTAAVGALRGLSEALGRADNVLKTVQAVLTPSSPLYYEAVSTLREIRFTASAAKSLFEYLQRNPNSILTGNR